MKEQIVKMRPCKACLKDHDLTFSFKPPELHLVGDFWIGYCNGQMFMVESDILPDIFTYSEGNA